MEAYTTVVVPRTVCPAQRGRSSDSTRCHSRDNACASRTPSFPPCCVSPPCSTPEQKEWGKKKIRSKLGFGSLSDYRENSTFFSPTHAHSYEAFRTSHSSSARNIFFHILSRGYALRQSPSQPSCARVYMRKNRAPAFTD